MTVYHRILKQPKKKLPNAQKLHHLCVNGLDVLMLSVWETIEQIQHMPVIASFVNHCYELVSLFCHRHRQQRAIGEYHGFPCFERRHPCHTSTGSFLLISSGPYIVANIQFNSQSVFMEILKLSYFSTF